MYQAADTESSVTPAPTEIGDGVDLQWLLDAVTNIDANASDAVLIDRITALERLKSGAAAAQARLTATFADSQTADGVARKKRPDAVRRSIAGQVALARRDSLHAGRRHVGVAAALVRDMPHTLAALTRGELSERRARTVIEQLACLTSAHRREADQILAPEFAGMGDRTAETRAAAVACRLDPEAVMGKIRGAVKDRHVSVRPAPDTMTRLSALLPVALGVAVYAALDRAAATATATPGGDPRNRGQLMADALVSAVTGRTITGCDPYGVPQYAPTTPAPTAPQHTVPEPTATPDACAPDAAATGPEDTDATGPDDEDATGPDDGDATGPDDEDATGPDDEDAEPSTVAAQPSTEPGHAAPTETGATTPAAPEPTAAAAPTPAPAASGRVIRAATCTGGCGITINLVMTDRTLLDCDDEPAHLSGYGPIPAALARALVIGSADTTTRTFIRRLYTDPVSGQLTAMDSKRRLFPAAAQRFLLARDQTCRTPWCDAPIREYDHLQPHADGGPTSTHNSRGACKACNLTKESPRWSARSADGTITLTTPTGHSYPSDPPPPPRSTPWTDISHTEHRFAKILLWTADQKPRKRLPRTG